MMTTNNSKSSTAGNRTQVFCVTGGNTNHYTTADLVLGPPGRAESSPRAWASSVGRQPEGPAATSTENGKSVQGVAHPALHVPGALSSNLAASSGGR